MIIVKNSCIYVGNEQFENIEILTFAILSSFLYLIKRDENRKFLKY